MPRRPTRQSVDTLLDLYQQAHRELALELDLEMAKVSGTTGRAKFLSERMGAIEMLIEKYRTGVDPLTGEVRLFGPGWQGLVGPDLTNGLAADIAHQAYASGLVLNEAILDGQGAPPAPRMASLHEQAATLIAEELTEATDAHLTGILRKKHDEFRDIQARATVAGITKGENLNALVTRLIGEYREKGITSFPTRRLKKDGTPVQWNIEAYARMLGRTIAHKASQRSHDLRGAESGLDLVIIVGGIGTATCETCIKALNPNRKPGEDPRPIYSRSGRSEKWPPLQALLDAEPPLGHPNCGHQWPPYWEPTTVTDEKIDELAQEISRRMGAERLIQEEGERPAEKVEKKPRAKPVRRVQIVNGTRIEHFAVDPKDPRATTIREEVEAVDPDLIALARRRSGRAPRLVIVGDRITDHPDLQHLRGVTPKGWREEGLTWDDINGAGAADGAFVSANAELQGTSDSGSVAVHELAHTIDFAVGGSSDPAFLKLHAEEVRAKRIQGTYQRTYPQEWFVEQIAKRTLFPKGGEEGWGKWKDERNFDQWYQDFLKRNK